MGATRWLDEASRVKPYPSPDVLLHPPGSWSLSWSKGRIHAWICPCYHPHPRTPSLPPGPGVTDPRNPSPRPPLMPMPVRASVIQQDTRQLMCPGEFLGDGWEGALATP